MVFSIPAGAEMLEVRGDVVNLAGAQAADLVWNACNFAAFWYDLDDDLMTETLTIAATDGFGNPTLNFYYCDRTIDNDCLVYSTSPVYREYELYENENLTVESSHPGGDTGYWVEGWMGEMYVAIDNNADKLTKLLVEFEDYDKKTQETGVEWDLRGGFALTANQVIGDDTVEFTLSKNGLELDNKNVSVGEVYTYTTYLDGEYDVPVFSCYVDAVFNDTDIDIVQMMYVFLIDDAVMEIDCGDEYGVMEVMTASSSQVILKNNETTLYVDEGTTHPIMGDMCFKTADDENAIRFYPMVAYAEPTTDTDGDGVPDVWDVDNSTPSGYWVNPQGIGRKWGDMNGDGKLTSVDALMILQAAVGGIELTPTENVTLRPPKPIYLDDYAFTPKNPTIHVGEALNWINLQKSPMVDFVLVSEGGLWDNQTISYGKKFKYTFNTSGRYTYYCPGYGSAMRGTVTVFE